jgi:hypothetical protein
MILGMTMIGTKYFAATASICLLYNVEFFGANSATNLLPHF